MSYAFPPDIDAMVQRQLATGQFKTPDDVLRVALNQLETEEVDEEEVRAIQEALDELAQGDEGIPVREAFDAIRKKYDIPADA